VSNSHEALFLKRRWLLPLSLLCGLVASSACEAPHRTGKPAPSTGAERTIVVVNGRSAASDSVARYYVAKRGIDASHVVRIDVPATDEIGDIEFRTSVVAPVRSAIEALPVRIDFIVLTTGVPIRVARKNGYSVDALLAGMNLPIPPMVGLDTAWLRRYRNPYFNARVPFNSDQFGMFLVTRLDCAQLSDCFALVDRATNARPVRGPFYFDAAPLRRGNDGA
jgi:uncharacterized protein (TIGR03790 family)